MKKIFVLGLFVILLSFSCTEKVETGSEDATSSIDKNTMNIMIEGWKEAGMLPIPEGFEKSIGVAGAFSAFIGDKLIVAGGSNFPYKSVLEGGAKEFYSDIFVFDVMDDNTLKHVGTAQLPKKLSTGAVVKPDENTLYFVGGENADGDSASVYSVTLDNNTPIVEEIFNLPFTFAAGSVLLNNNKLYLIAGRQNKKSSNASFEIDLDTKKATELAPLPADARVQMPYTMIDDKIYIFNGLGSLTLTDNYVYDISSKSWSKLADTTINNKPYTIAGGASVAIDDNYILILGGVNKEVFDDAVTQLGSLKGEQLQAFKEDYFSRSPEQFNFGKEEVIYDIQNDKWYSIGQTPFYGNAGPFPLLIRNDMSVWRISGEVKAGVRVPDIQVANIKK